MDDVIRVVRRRLLRWYKKYQRDLPWRHTRDPYTILVSEIMLQQTQVERVIPKYHAFLRAFPTVKVLANAKTADVIRMWKGLGYNRRALFLQRAAKVVCDEFSGVFPDTLKELITLPGVGDYTARAVMSFAFEKKVPMMDTNHRRFYTRVYYGIKDVSDKDLLITAEEVFSKCRAYDWNQALMDFGSTICLTRVPKCGICPLQEHCKAYPKILTSKVFKKKKKKQSVRFKDTDRYYRGQIVDILRGEKRVLIHSLQSRFSDIDSIRFNEIVLKLAKDGLIIKGRKYIKLPQ